MNLFFLDIHHSDIVGEEIVKQKLQLLGYEVDRPLEFAPKKKQKSAEVYDLDLYRNKRNQKQSEFIKKR